MKLYFHQAWLHLGAAMLLAAATAAPLPATASTAGGRLRPRADEGQPTRLYNHHRLPRLNGSKGSMTYKHNKKSHSRKGPAKCADDLT